NIRDFARLARTTPHAGIILVSPQRFPRTGNGLSRLHTALHDLLAQERLLPTGGVIWLEAAPR
ncbi:MAG TPA: hypothetical protein VFX60_03405, partial [Micromonospora sp.]|nr:hypothetical protein [Micromonospora sp.]